MKTWSGIPVTLFLASAALMALIFAGSAQAEGTYQLTSGGGYRPWSEWRNDQMAGIGSGQADGIYRRTIVKAYVEQGEVVYLASSVFGYGAAEIHVFYPNNASWEPEVGSPSPDITYTKSTLGANFSGRIQTRIQEQQGPYLGSGSQGNKFTAKSFTAPQTGVYVFFFTSPNPNATTSNDNPPPIAVNGNWENVQDTAKAYMAAWDVTITSSGVVKVARVFLNYLAVNTGSTGLSINGVVWPVTYDGFRYKIDFHGLDMSDGIIYADNKGVINRSTYIPLYKSEQLVTTNGDPDWYFPEFGATMIHNPSYRNDATHTLYTTKMFLTDPWSKNLPGTALEANETRWLYPTPPSLTNSLTVHSVSFTGNEGTNANAGTNNGTSFYGTLVLNMTNSSTEPRDFKFYIDMSNSGVGNGSYDDIEDVVFTGVCPGSATNQNVTLTPVWYGLYGDGTVIPAQTFNSLSYKLFISTGELHLVFIDAETNSQGIIVQRSGTTAQNPISNDQTKNRIGWNDTEFGGTSSPGTDSQSGKHLFSTGFGNGKVIDSWNFYPTDPGTGSFGPISFREADLAFTSVTLYNTQVPSDEARRGMTAQLRFAIQNLGPTNVNGSGLSYSDQKAQIDIEVVTADIDPTYPISWYIGSSNLSTTQFFPADLYHPVSSDLAFPINTFASGDSVYVIMDFKLALGPNPLINPVSIDVLGKVFRPLDYNDPDDVIRYNPTTPTNNILETTIGAQPLPVELTSFSARTVGSNVHLKWATVTEVNNYGFEVQRNTASANDERNWATVGFVEGAGSVNTPRQYSYVDNDANRFGSVVSFRLKQVDLDGTFSYSAIAQARFNKAGSDVALAPLYPNPVASTTSDVTTLNYSLATSGDVRLSVYNATGREVKVLDQSGHEAGNFSTTLNTKGMQPGTYMIVLVSNGLRSAQKLVILR